MAGTIVASMRRGTERRATWRNSRRQGRAVEASRGAPAGNSSRTRNGSGDGPAQRRMDFTAPTCPHRMPDSGPGGLASAVVTNKSDRMHAFWLDQLEEAAEGLATEGAEWSASLM